MTQTKEFSALGLTDRTLEAIRSKGFETPSPIQRLTIPALLDTEKTNDIIAEAQTGTGKTAAFLLPVLSTLPRADSRTAPSAQGRDSGPDPGSYARAGAASDRRTAVAERPQQAVDLGHLRRRFDERAAPQTVQGRRRGRRNAGPDTRPLAPGNA